MADVSIDFQVADDVVQIIHDLPANVSGRVGDVFITQLTAIGASGDPIEADYEVTVDDPGVVTASVTDAVLEVRMIDVGVGAVIVKSSARLAGGGAISTGAPAYDPGAHTLVYQDDMSKYTDWDDMGTIDRGETAFAPAPSVLYYGGQPNPPGYEDDHYSFITGRGGSGQALRVWREDIFPAQGSEGLYLYRVPAAASRTQHNYIQFWARLTFESGDPEDLSCKWFMFWHPSFEGPGETGTFPNSRTQWMTHWPAVNGCPSSSSPIIWTPFLSSLIDHPCYAPQAIGPYNPQIGEGGLWHKYTYEYKAQDTWGSKDGILRMWIDDVKVCDISAAAVDVTPPGGEFPYCLEAHLETVCTASYRPTTSAANHTLMWLSNQTGDATGNWTFDVDDFAWWIKT